MNTRAERSPPGGLQSWAAHFVWFSFHAVCEPRRRFGLGVGYDVLSLRLFPQPREVSMRRLSAAWSPRAGRRFFCAAADCNQDDYQRTAEWRRGGPHFFLRCRSRRGAFLDVA
jgi:hypothetical protein